MNAATEAIYNKMNDQHSIAHGYLNQLQSLLRHPDLEDLVIAGTIELLANNLAGELDQMFETFVEAAKGNG